MNLVIIDPSLLPYTRQNQDIDTLLCNRDLLSIFYKMEMHQIAKICISSGFDYVYYDPDVQRRVSEGYKRHSGERLLIHENDLIRLCYQGKKYDNYERQININDILYDKEKFAPDIQGFALCDIHCLDLKRCILSSLTYMKIHSQDRNRYRIYYGINYKDESQIAASAFIYLVDGGDIIPADGLGVEGCMRFALRKADIFSEIELGGLFAASKTVEMLKFVVELWNWHRDSESTFSEVHNYRFGGDFLKSIRDRKFTPSIGEKILRAVFETLDDVNLQDMHPFNIDKHGGSPQLVREKDGAKAWRRDIDRDHHLHYWRNGKLIDFAWVCYPYSDKRFPE